MSIVYKTLFEVKVLHEFYLTDSDGQTIFALANQEDRNNYLFDHFKRNKRNIDEELEFAVPEKHHWIFDDFHLKLLTTYAGFKVAIRVDQEKLGDGTLIYRPKIDLPDDLGIPVLMARKSNRIDGITNGRMRRPVNSVGYFTNESTGGPKVYPFLSGDIPDFDATFNYEQGEIARFGPNDVREFYLDDSNTPQWLALVGDGYVGDNDRMLVSPGFFYNFQEDDNVTEVNFALRDSSANLVRALHFKGAGPLGKVFLKFEADGLKTVPAAAAGPGIVYTLEATGDNGYHKTIRLVFNDGSEGMGNPWALAHIKVKATNVAFDLTDAGGLLIMRKKPDGTYDPPAPVFEVRVRSRLTFWRYINDEHKDLKSGIHTDFLIWKDGQLVSILPRPLSFNPTLFKKADNTLHYLPNPKPYETARAEGGKLFTDIYVPESPGLFPLNP